MPTVKLDKYYQIKEDYAKKLIHKYKTFVNIAKLCKMPLNVVENVFNQSSKLSTSYAMRMCSLEGIELEKGFDLFEPNTQELKDITHIQLSERLISGFKLNIHKRLSITHSKMFVDEIMNLIDNIVDESCYLGIECCEKGKTDYILKRVIKRRRNE